MTTQTVETLSLIPYQIATAFVALDDVEEQLREVADDADVGDAVKLVASARRRLRQLVVAVDRITSQ